MYNGGSNSSFAKSLGTSIPTFFAGVTGFTLFSTMKGSLTLHEYTLQYVDFFLNHVNYFNIGFAVCIATILGIYFYTTFFLYFIFDLDTKNVKSWSFRSFFEVLLNISMGIGYSGFAIAIFSPYLEFARETYNYYHLMLGIQIMILGCIGIIAVILIQFFFNSFRSPIPSVVMKIKSSFAKKPSHTKEYEPQPFETMDHSMPQGYEEDYGDPASYYQTQATS